MASYDATQPPANFARGHCIGRLGSRWVGGRILFRVRGKQFCDYLEPESSHDKVLGKKRNVGERS